jgi:hypothetical protein
MTYKIRWNGDCPVVFFEGDRRIELSKGEEVEVEMVPTGTGFEIIDGKIVELENKEEEKIKLKETLEKEGLSPIRVEKVCSRFDSLDELKSNLDKLPFEEVTNKWLRDKFSDKNVEQKVTEKKNKKKQRRNNRCKEIPKVDL